MEMTRQQRLLNQQVFISCIVPIHNEAELIEDFVKALRQHLMSLDCPFEILFIDDGSTDQTYFKILPFTQHPSIKLIRFSRNFGKENAISAGLKNCSGDIAIIMDGDFQHPISILSAFIAKWTEGYDMVYGLRQDRHGEPFGKRLFARFFYRLIGFMAQVQIPANAGDFRLLDRAVIDAMNCCEERTRFMKGLYSWVGFQSVAVPFRVEKRRAGKSSHPFRRLAELAITGITSFSDIPLRVWGLIGLIISLFSLGTAAFIIVDTLLYGIDVPGYATIIVTIIFFGGIQLLSIGILGEYIARIFTEVKKRPPYIIAKSHNLLQKEPYVHHAHQSDTTKHH